MNISSRIWVAGGDTLIGAALVEYLREKGYAHLVGIPPSEPDTQCPGQLDEFFAEAKPEYVFVAAGRSGGIGLNRTQPADLMLDNLLAVSHILRAAHEHGVKKLLYLGSSCMYPREAPQPLRVESLMTGTLEQTNVGYATAKLAGWQLCRAYRQQHGMNCVTVIPANGFGPHDDFAAESGHVIPALIRRAIEAKERDEPTLTVWGTGKPRRDFIYSRDLAEACALVMQRYEGEEPINVGSGSGATIAEVARAVAEVVGFRGRIQFDDTNPDGMPVKILETTPIRNLGWNPKVTLVKGLRETFECYLEQGAHLGRESASEGWSRR